MDLRSILGLAVSIGVYRLNLPKQRRIRRLYRQFVDPGDLAFDVGAHVGDRTWALRALGCRVVAVEPQPAPLALLRRLYGRAPDVVLETCALAATAGAAELIVSRRNPTVSSLSADWVERAGRTTGFRTVDWDRRVTVPVRTLDELIAQHGAPRFCKIDVEGHEAEVLRGLNRPIETVSFEFLASRPELALECLDELGRLGPYRFNISFGETLRLELPEWRPAEAVADLLRDIPTAVGSGDVYARRAD